MSSPDQQQLRAKALGGNLLAFVCLLVLAIRSDDLPLLTAAASTDGAEVWVLTPYVAPGDEVVLDVGVRDKMRIAFREIDVDAPGLAARFEGEGTPWGAVITEKPTDEARAHQVVRFHVPKGTPVDAGLVLDVTARVEVAKSTTETFHVASDTRHVPVTLRIQSRAGTLTRKLLALGWGAGWLAFVAVLVGRRYWQKAERTSGAPSSLLGDLTQRFSISTVFGLALYGLATYVAFADPVRGALGLTGDATTASLLALGFVAPLWLGRRLAGRPPLTPLGGRIEPLDASERTVPYRVSAGRVDTVPARKVASHLASLSGLHVKATATGLSVTSGGRVYRAPREVVAVSFDGDAITPGGIDLRFNDTALVVRVAKALLSQLGPFALVLSCKGRSHRYLIDAATDEKTIVEDFRAAQRQDIELDETRRELLSLLEARVATGETTEHPPRAPRA